MNYKMVLHSNKLARFILLYLFNILNMFSILQTLLFDPLITFNRYSNRLLYNLLKYLYNNLNIKHKMLMHFIIIKENNSFL